MSQRVGLCGAHRTGKTSLAKVVAAENRIEYVDALVRKAFEDRGIGVSDAISLMDRLEIQYDILASFTGDLLGKTNFVTDRTPLDMAAYAMSFLPNDADENTASLYLDYVNNCIEATTLLFDTIVLVQPGIPVVNEASSAKGIGHTAWQERLNITIAGFFHDPQLRSVRRYIMPRDKTDMQERTVIVSKAIAMSELYAGKFTSIH